MASVLSFTNIEVVIVALGLLAALVTFSALSRRLERGSSLIIGLAIGAIAAYSMYTYRLYLGENLVAFALIAVVILIFGKLLYSFLRFGRRVFRR